MAFNYFNSLIFLVEAVLGVGQLLIWQVTKDWMAV